MNSAKINSRLKFGLKRSVLMTAVLSASLFIVGCSSNDNAASDAVSDLAEFEIVVTNLSASQPMSPIALAMHNPDWTSFTTGEPASLALENLAEGGDNSTYLAAADASNNVFYSESGSGAISPGASETLTVQVNQSALGTLSFSVLSMLINTNDAVVAINNQSIASMSLNETLGFNALSYDSGTEANTETADTMPGPAAAGGAQEGFNAVRDDVRDAVYVHAGVVTQSDGLASSVLSAEHRWDHPVFRVTVERTQ